MKSGQKRMVGEEPGPDGRSPHSGCIASTATLNRTLFIAMTLQLPKSLKAAERTISSRDLEPETEFMRDPIADRCL